MDFGRFLDCFFLFAENGYSEMMVFKMIIKNLEEANEGRRCWGEERLRDGRRVPRGSARERQPRIERSWRAREFASGVIHAPSASPERTRSEEGPRQERMYFDLFYLYLCVYIFYLFLLRHRESYGFVNEKKILSRFLGMLKIVYNVEKCNI